MKIKWGIIIFFREIPLTLWQIVILLNHTGYFFTPVMTNSDKLHSETHSKIHKGGEKMVDKLPKILKLKRVAAELTLEELTRRVGMSPGYWSEVERGKYVPGLKLLSRVCEALQVPLWQVIKEAEEANAKNDSETKWRADIHRLD